MKMEPFNHNYFLGYINEVNPQMVKIHYPSPKLMKKFHHQGMTYFGGNVGNFIIIEGDEIGFLGRIISVQLPDSDRRSLSEKAMSHDNPEFYPSAQAEILLSFSIYEPEKVQKTVSKYPEIGAKVFCCSDDQISKYIRKFGQKEDKTAIYAEIGELTANKAKCYASLDALFGRHCAIVGTTGGGKSWTVSKLIEEVVANSKNKVILIDATGEYKNIATVDVIVGENSYFPYDFLSLPDLFYLLRPTGQSQRPILLEAIRSLKMIRIAKEKGNISNEVNVCIKASKSKEKFNIFYRENITQIENNKCDFDINFLAEQIKYECVYPTEFNDITKWGGADNRTYDYQTSLISRILDLVNSKIFRDIFGFANDNSKNSLVGTIENFLSNESQKTQVLRIGFEKIPSSFSAKEILANSLGTFLLNKARNSCFKKTPILLVIDEAHQFLNKNLKDENFDSQTLESFDLIAKECRKYGLFLCLATQMPRDIPVGTLSQVGTFIVHRLINEQDKKAIENACSAANRAALSFLPILGEGEALLVGVDFPMPLTLKINIPNVSPLSETPTFSQK